VTAAAGAPERTPEEQLAWERDAGRLPGYTALLSGAFLLATLIYEGTALRQRLHDSAEQLVFVNGHEGRVVAVAILNAIGVALFVPVLRHLWRASRYRRPETPEVGRILAIAAPIAVAVTTIAGQVAVIDAAHEFMASSVRTAKHADELQRSGGFVVVAGLGLAGRVALGFAYLLVSLHAMRAGVLSRFLGIVGIIVGVLFAVPLLGSGTGILEIFWIVAVALIVLDRWPGGRGPAWETAEPIPWPTAGERREAIERMEARERDRTERPAEKPETATGEDAVDPPTERGDGAAEAEPERGEAAGRAPAGMVRGGPAQPRRRKKKRRKR
jgi:hypothetical protein